MGGRVGKIRKKTVKELKEFEKNDFLKMKMIFK